MQSGAGRPGARNLRHPIGSGSPGGRCARATTTPASRWTTSGSTTWAGCGGSCRRRDVLPGLLADEARLAPMEEAQVFGADWSARSGVIPNEYLYYYYFNRDAVRRIMDSAATRGDFLLETQNRFFADAAGGSRPCGESCGATRSTRAAPATWPRPRAASRARPPSSANASPTRRTRATRVSRSA